MLSLLSGFLLAMNTMRTAPREVKSIQAHFHSAAERQFYAHHMRFTWGPGQYFLRAARCEGCHGHDTTGLAGYTHDSVDVNLFDAWESSMMALSAKDPLWRAKVSQEIMTDTAHALALQTKCTSCHAPMGHYTALFNGASSYTINDLVQDSVGLDGVSCLGCHMIGPSVGTTFSGNIPYDTTRKEYGPFQNPLQGPMQLYVGLTPTYSTHMDNSKLCSPCHTLITNTVDLSGNLTGGTFVEQATYHEWQNSASAGDNFYCQRCHMPQAPDSIVIANQHLNLPPRFPFNMHKFMGGNTFMLQLIKQNKSALGVGARDINFDSTIARTYFNLQQHTLQVDLTLDSLHTDTAYFHLKLYNLAGHKFPSGYPSRRAVVQFIVKNDAQDTVFQSGVYHSNYEVAHLTGPWEPHHDIINRPDQAQIYEMIMGDVNGNRTTVLERAATCLKDNRLPPEGFFTSFYNYDTVKIVGDAAGDHDFNRYPNGDEGGGQDVVHYHVPVTGLQGNLSAHAFVYYQAVPSSWLNEMFALNSPAIDTFRTMFLAADRSPVLVGSDSLTVLHVQVPELHQSVLNVWPTLSSNGWVHLQVDHQDFIREVSIYEVSGKLVAIDHFPGGQPQADFLLPEAAGTYLIEVQLRGRKETRKVVRQ